MVGEIWYLIGRYGFFVGVVFIALPNPACRMAATLFTYSYFLYRQHVGHIHVKHQIGGTMSGVQPFETAKQIGFAYTDLYRLVVCCNGTVLVISKRYDLADTYIFHGHIVPIDRVCGFGIVAFGIGFKRTNGVGNLFDLPGRRLFMQYRQVEWALTYRCHAYSCARISFFEFY